MSQKIDFEGQKKREKIIEFTCIRKGRLKKKRGKEMMREEDRGTKMQRHADRCRDMQRKEQ